MIDPLSLTLAGAAACVAGAMNAVAGGGSFFTFPALILGGMSPLAANATNTVALWPGSLASIFGYREEIPKYARQTRSLIVASFLGGLAGALLLLAIPETTFEAMIPWLMLVATLLFALSGHITALLRGSKAAGFLSPNMRTALAFVLQFGIATYGGFFGAGLSILMLALMGLFGWDDIHSMNGIKALLGSLINGVAVVTFIVAGIVSWPEALVMAVFAIIGGYGGARLSRRVKREYIRRFVIVVGAVLTTIFFFKY